MQSIPASGSNVIEVEDLSKTYPGARHHVLNGLTFTVKGGEILWISGPSGAGKSTLLNVLGLLTMADSGSYRINGMEMLTASKETRRIARATLLSIVFQRGNLFPHLNAVDNVLIGMTKGCKNDAFSHLDAVGLAEKSQQLSGLLSGGEQERVAIARASARHTPILLADEPIAGLDELNATKVLDLLTSTAESGVAVVVVSHDDRTARVATCTLVLPGAGS